MELLNFGHDKVTIDGTTYILQDIDIAENTTSKITVTGVSTLNTKIKLFYECSNSTESAVSVQTGIQNQQVWKKDVNMQSIAVYSKKNTYTLESYEVTEI